jgi:hypothetical protein
VSLVSCVWVYIAVRRSHTHFGCGERCLVCMWRSNWICCHTEEKTCFFAICITMPKVKPRLRDAQMIGPSTPGLVKPLVAFFHKPAFDTTCDAHIHHKISRDTNIQLPEYSSNTILMAYQHQVFLTLFGISAAILPLSPAPLTTVYAVQPSRLA